MNIKTKRQRGKKLLMLAEEAEALARKLVVEARELLLEADLEELAEKQKRKTPDSVVKRLENAVAEVKRLKKFRDASNRLPPGAMDVIVGE